MRHGLLGGRPLVPRAHLSACCSAVAWVTCASSSAALWLLSTARSSFMRMERACRAGARAKTRRLRALGGGSAVASGTHPTYLLLAAHPHPHSFALPSLPSSPLPCSGCCHALHPPLLPPPSPLPSPGSCPVLPPALPLPSPPPGVGRPTCSSARLLLSACTSC